MDNDDFRRGQPTNHKKFGEDVALLAGDALLTDAFAVLTELNKVKPETILKIIKEFSLAAGSQGMVSGQTWDMKVDKDITFDQLVNIHQLKTGKLIEFAVTAVALFAELPKEQIDHFKTFGKNLGLAFQIKDDLLDQSDNAQDSKSFPFLIGEEKTYVELNAAVTKAQTALAHLSSYPTQTLKMILDYNLERKK
jgi:geranylgeranyl diphosphate synthase type II